MTLFIHTSFTKNDKKYRKFSNKGASPNKGAPCLSTLTQNFTFFGPPCFLRGNLTQNFTFLAISQPKMVRFSFCKKPLEAETVLYSTISCAFFREFTVFACRKISLILRICEIFLHTNMCRFTILLQLLLWLVGVTPKFDKMVPVPCLDSKNILITNQKCKVLVGTTVREI